MITDSSSLSSYATLFSWVFISMLFLVTATRLWLAKKQIAHVRAKRTAVPEVFAAKISLAAHQKAADYTCAKVRAGIVELGIEVLLLLALTFGTGLQLLHQWANGIFPDSPYLYSLLLVFALGLITTLIDLPLSLYQQFGIEARFGFNRMSLKLFFADMAKQMVLAVLIGSPLILAVLWLMGKMGEFWWLWVWALWCIFNLTLIFVYPTWIAPLFNKFTPLENAELKTRIESLLERCGFRSGGLFVMDGSKRSAHGNAYFTGFGKTRRIVFFDTLIERLSGCEIEAVLAHELGHFKHKHIVKRIVMSFVGALFFLWLLGWLMKNSWFYTGMGLDAQNTILALILFFLVMPVFTFFFTPLFSLLSRRNEFEADAYAKSQTRAEDLVSALIKLYEDNASTLTPDPLYSAFYNSHPPALQRIARLEQNA